ncbi:hypothetical protein DPEC_G00344820 [Dallia pectoralis]|uniref:Uncharacterized protein n=1 Tax=Dallia pectoralis TaxID=75939 RepID=A0ACC2F3B7_DALPE|nr:hypothetical protein DPEC_G00344820 [Dallia pectoralis]
MTAYNEFPCGGQSDQCDPNLDRIRHLYIPHGHVENQTTGRFDSGWTLSTVTVSRLPSQSDRMTLPRLVPAEPCRCDGRRRDDGRCIYHD